MAKVNLSAAIKTFLAKPGKADAGPKEVIAALAKKNIVVSTGLVSNVKTNLKKAAEAAAGGTATKTAKPKKSKSASKSAPVSTSNGSVTLADACSLVKQFGSVAAVEAALAQMKELGIS